MKIVFYIDSFADGGAARVVSSVSRELYKRGEQVYIATNTIHRKISYQVGEGISFFRFMARSITVVRLFSGYGFLSGMQGIS